MGSALVWSESFCNKCVKEKRLCVSEKMVVVVLLVSLFIPMERCGIHFNTNLGTSMRA
jgi:hypothetical protein